MKKILIKTTLWSTAIIVLTVVACKSEDKQKKSEPTEEKSRAEIFVPDFNADSAYAYVQKQVDFGPRAPGSEAHAQCAQWLTNTMKRFTPNVEVQHFKARIFDRKTYNGQNIIGIFNPEKKERILLCAHWDTRPFADHDPNPENRNTPIDGANDGASGVGVLLEVARQFNLHNPDIGVDIIFFDLEDFGKPQATQLEVEDDWCLGSQYWSRTPHKPGYRAKFGILLDMVGVPNPNFTQEGMSVYFARHIVDKVWSIASQLGYEQYFPTTETPAIIDDHYYINKLIRIPTIDIIHYEPESSSGFFHYWHTVDDTMEHIDKETLRIVGDVVLTVVYWE